MAQLLQLVVMVTALGVAGGTQAVLAAQQPASAPCPTVCRKRLCTPWCMDRAWSASVTIAGAAACRSVWPDSDAACDLLAADLSAPAMRTAVAEYIRAAICVYTDCCGADTDAAVYARFQSAVFRGWQMRPRTCTMLAAGGSASTRQLLCAGCRALLADAVTVNTPPPACDEAIAAPPWVARNADCVHVQTVANCVAADMAARAPANVCEVMGCCDSATAADAAGDGSADDLGTWLDGGRRPLGALGPG